MTLSIALVVRAEEFGFEAKHSPTLAFQRKTKTVAHVFSKKTKTEHPVYLYKNVMSVCA